MKSNRLSWKPDGLLIYAAMYLTFIYLPVLFLPLFSFNSSTYITFPLKDFTLKWYDKMINSPDMHQALFNSIKVLCYRKLT